MRIIAVDDERMALENILNEITKATSGEVHEIKGFREASDALAYAEKETCDVAFLDIEMRDMNGLALAERLQKSKIEV